MHFNSTDRPAQEYYNAPQTPPSPVTGPTMLPRQAPVAGRTPRPDSGAYRQPRLDEPSPKARRRTDSRLAMLLAALASAGAGVIHAAAAPAHWTEWQMAGLFFVAVAFFQIAWAVLVLPFANRFFAALGLMANLGILGLWVYSRWKGLPIGPHAGAPEAISVADTVSSALGALVVAGTLWALLPRERHGILSPGGYHFLLVFAALAIGAALIPAVDSALSHGEDGHSHGTEEGDGHDDHEHGTDEDMQMDEEATETPADSEEATEPEPSEDHTHAPGEEHD